MKSLTLKNYFLIQENVSPTNIIESIQEWLNKQMLHGPVSRARTRFIKLIVDRAKEIDSERMKILEQCAKKAKEKKEVDGKKTEVEMTVYADKDGKETTDKKKGVEYIMQDREKFVKEYGELLQENLVIDVTPANQKTINEVKDLILNTDYKFEKMMANRYDEWCQAFEDIS